MLRYKCPYCGERKSFTQTATVKNVFWADGVLIEQQTIKQGKTITCCMCDKSGPEELFENWNTVEQ